MFFAKGIAMPLFFIRRRLYVHEFHHTRGDARCRELQFHIFSPHPRAHPLAMKFKSTYFLPTSTCPSACRDARSERPGNFVYNQSETDFLICRTLRPSVPTRGCVHRQHVGGFVINTWGGCSLSTSDWVGVHYPQVIGCVHRPQMMGVFTINTWVYSFSPFLSSSHLLTFSLSHLLTFSPSHLLTFKHLFPTLS